MRKAGVQKAREIEEPDEVATAATPLLGQEDTSETTPADADSTQETAGKPH